MTRPYWNVRRVAMLVAAVVLAALVLHQYAVIPLPQELWLMLVPAGLLITLAVEEGLRHSTNGILREFLGWPARYKSFNDTYPSYRHADLFRALERLAEASAWSLRLEHALPNVALLGLIRTPSLVQPTPSEQTKLCVGYEQFAFFPNDSLWLLRGPPGLGAEDRVVVRLSNHHGPSLIEVGAADPDQAAHLLKWIADESLAHSIYRGQFLEVHYHRTYHAEFEYAQMSPEMIISFKARPNVHEDDILLEDGVRAILDRSVFDFFAHRDSLYAVGVPRKRALLFYGPPGTGKTHTCRHIHTRLQGATSILVAGESLTRLQDIGKFARQLHPSLLVVEDVDLVFTSREHNPYGTILGELMDQLDGFTADEEVMFILTTNAIERVEEAIRDRPGRINQCLHFGLPNPDLRRRYLERYLLPYDVSAVDLAHLVKKTERTSQAFLKEYVLRAVQVAAAAAGYPNNGRLGLETKHFDTAFDELTGHGNPSGHAIMGFRVER